MPGQLFNLNRYFKKSSAPSAADPPASPLPVASAPVDPVKTNSSTTPNPETMQKVSMDVLTRLTQRANQVVLTAANKAREKRVQYIDTEHLLWALLSDSGIYQLLSELKVSLNELQAEVEKNLKGGNYDSPPQFSPRVKKVLDLSLSAARSLNYEFISPEHLLLALTQEKEGLAAKILSNFGVTTEVLNKKVLGKSEGVTDDRKKLNTIDFYCLDLTAQAREGKLDPVVGRAAEIERVIHILSRRTKNNPCLIGDAGVGKTAIVEGLAQKIAKGDVPESLVGKRILSLDLMSLVAGASHRGEFEERLKNLLKEVKTASGQIILFIDEIHNMVGAGAGEEGTLDASNILKPSLARGELQTIGTTTVTEYRHYIEKDPALERRFQPVLVAEPTAEVAIEMLKAIRDKYEAFHKVSISDEAIEAAVRLSQKYIGDRFLPDKAVDLIDEAAAAVRLPAISLPEEIKSLQDKIKRLAGERAEAEKIADKIKIESLDKEIEEIQKVLAEKTKAFEEKQSTTTNVVTPGIIAEIVSRWSGIPVSRLTESESEKLLNLEDLIHKNYIDQDEAVSAIAEAVRRGRAGLTSGKRPIGSFIFMGPTGVGKTELAKALAEILFGSPDLMVRMDMSEYMEKHEAAKLIGAPPGYVGYEEGGQLTEAVRRHPYSVVLFDEIEKAHPDVFNVLLQILDDGRLTDNKGHVISFKNTIIICTSNIGTGLIQKSLIADGGPNFKAPTEEEKKQADQKFVQLAEKLLEELKKFFRPEILNRFDEVIVFRPLSGEVLLKIAELQVSSLAKILAEQNIRLQITPAAKEQIARLGYDPLFGARPLRRTLQREVENQISSLLIRGQVKSGETIFVDLVNGEFQFNQQKPEPAPMAEEKVNQAKVYFCQHCRNQFAVKELADKKFAVEKIAAEAEPAVIQEGELVCPFCQSKAINPLGQESPETGVAGLPTQELMSDQPPQEVPQSGLTASV